MKLEINHWVGLEPDNNYRVYLDAKLINQFKTKSEASSFCDRLIRKEKINRINGKNCSK